MRALTFKPAGRSHGRVGDSPPSLQPWDRRVDVSRRRPDDQRDEPLATHILGRMYFYDLSEADDEIFANRPARP
jgi:hypothetical protein